MAQVGSFMAKTCRLLIPTSKTFQLRSVTIYAKESIKKTQHERPPINGGNGGQTNKGGRAYNPMDASEDNRKAQVDDDKLGSKK